MSEHSYKIEIMDCDLYSQLPPSGLLSKLLNVVVEEFRDGGVTRDIIFPAINGCWMIAKFEYEQTRSITYGETIRVITSPRYLDKKNYVFFSDVYSGEELVVKYKASYIPVDYYKRHLIELRTLEKFWTVPSGGESPEHLSSIKCEDMDFTPCYEDLVRLSDCDGNRHMTAASYLNLCCNALGFWESENPRFIKKMHFDFLSEILPGTRVFCEKHSDECEDSFYLKGIKEDGRLAFTSYCEFNYGTNSHQYAFNGK